MPTMGVYAIRHKATGRVYIGASKNVVRRFVQHRHYSANTALRRDLRRDGPSAFEYRLLEEVAVVEALPTAEERWLRSAPVEDLYNAPWFLTGGHWGHRHALPGDDAAGAAEG